MSKIDFVVLWVDGADEEWLREKRKYDSSAEDVAASAARFRDWDILQYWFRGVEKFAPWVNNVFFVTWGHLPGWLNTGHPKLKIVKHTDYMPADYLPTFNSNPIEFNLHRIPELSEQFVLFNDDMFLIRPLKEEDVFKDGKPVDEFEFNTGAPTLAQPIIAHTCTNNLAVINKHFKKNDVVKKNFRKILTLRYGSRGFRTLLLMPWGGFVGIYNPHIPQPHLKSAFEEVWEKEGKILDETCRNKFRTYYDLNHWLMRYWNLCKGNFVPRRKGFGRLFTIRDDNVDVVASYIAEGKGLTVCINDSNLGFDLDRAKQRLKAAFDRILPEKSQFEK